MKKKHAPHRMAFIAVTFRLIIRATVLANMGMSGAILMGDHEKKEKGKHQNPHD